MSTVINHFQLYAQEKCVYIVLAVFIIFLAVKTAKITKITPQPIAWCVCYVNDYCANPEHHAPVLIHVWPQHIFSKGCQYSNSFSHAYWWEIRMRQSSFFQTQYIRNSAREYISRAHFHSILGVHAWERRAARLARGACRRERGKVSLFFPPNFIYIYGEAKLYRASVLVVRWRERAGGNWRVFSLARQ